MTDANLRDIESETGVIGSIILQPDAIERIWGQIEPGDFSDERNRKVFRAEMDLYADGRTIDRITLNAKLSQENGDGEDWNLYLSGMLSGLPNCLNIESYAAIVAELADKRHLLSCSQNLTTAITENNGIEAAKADLRAFVEHTRRGGADPWETSIRTLADAYKPRPPREYLVQGIIPVPSLTMVYSPAGGLKSALLADMALSVAAGLPFLQLDPADHGIETRQAPVYWLDFDNGIDETDIRFEAFARARGLSPDIPLYYWSMPSPWLEAADPEHMERFSARIQKRNARLVFIDNFRTISGELDENKPEISRAMSALRQLVDRLRIALILIHHPPKADDTVRGHSSINCALDLALLVKRDAESDTITISSTKTRHHFIKPFGARFSYTWKEGTNELETARFWGCSNDDFSQETVIESTLNEVLQGWSEKTAPCKTQIIQAANPVLQNVGVNKIRRAIDRLVKQGQWIQTDGPNNSKRYEVSR